MLDIKIKINGQPHYTVEKHSDQTYYKLVENYDMSGVYDGITFNVTFNKGFSIDGASVPRSGWSLLGINPGGFALMPALFHDLMYIYAGDIANINISGKAVIQMSVRNRRVLVLSRRDSDKIFAALMKKNGFNKLQCKTCYRILRLFGNIYWGKKWNPSIQPVGG